VRTPDPFRGSLKLFFCPICQQALHFEIRECTQCWHALAYLPDRSTLTAPEKIVDEVTSRKRHDRAIEVAQ
jgi:hypothetical protein